MDDGTAVSDPLPGYGAFRVSRNGQVYIGGGGGAVFRVSPGGLQSLEQSEAPPAMVLGGTAISTLFSGSEEGVAQFVNLDWQLRPGSPRYVRDLWQSPNGVLFATTVDAGSGQLWRHDAGSWSQLRGDPLIERPHVYGRSEDDFYFWMGRNIIHWDGAQWSALPEMPCTGPRAFVYKVTFAGSNVILAKCFPGFDLDRLFEFDGTSWTRLTPVAQFDLYQVGPAEEPVTYLKEWTGSSPPTYRLRSQSGWSPLSLPSGYDGLLTSVDGSRFVSSNGERYATTDGIQPWSVVASWAARSTAGYRGVLAGLWTDGSFAGSIRSFGGEPESGGPGQSIVLCELGALSD